MEKTDGVIEINEKEKGFNAVCEESFPAIIQVLRDGVAYITPDNAEIIKSAALFYKLGDVIKTCEYVANQPKEDVTAFIIQQKTEQITKLQIDANQLNKQIKMLTESNQIGNTKNLELEDEIDTLIITVEKTDARKNALEIEIASLQKKCDELELGTVKVAALEEQIKGLLIEKMLNFDVTEAETILAKGAKYNLNPLNGSIRSATAHSITKICFKLEMPTTTVLKIIGFSIHMPSGFAIVKVEVENGVISKQVDFVRFSQQKIYLLNREPLIAETDYQLKVHFEKRIKDANTTTAKKAAPKNMEAASAAPPQPKWTIYKPNAKIIFNGVKLIPKDGFENTLISEIVFDVEETNEPTAKLDAPVQEIKNPAEEIPTGEASEQLE